VLAVATAVAPRWSAAGRLSMRDAGIVALPVVGTVGHAALMYWQAGDPFASMTIQAKYLESARAAARRPLLVPALLSLQILLMLLHVNNYRVA
jgi:hypothetical protein